MTAAGDVERSRARHRDREVAHRHSPHLAQWALRDRLLGRLAETVRGLAAAGLPPRVLEVGAGHGGYTGPLLAAGCDVTAVDMSAPAAERLRARYGTNARLTAVADPDGDLAGVGGGYALVLCVSVLHHLPDYLGFLDRVVPRLLPGGAVLTVEDPLWYPRLGRGTRVADRYAYLAWRVGQGDVRQGLAAMHRRLRGRYPEARPGDIVYHHVVRQGVDEEAVAELLAPRFARVEVLSYWSNHLAAARRPAELAGLANTFSVRATGFRR